MLTVSQTPSWRNAARRPSAASSGNVVSLVVASLGQALEGLLPEDVDAAAHPVRQARRLAEPVTTSSLAELDDAEGERSGATTIVAAAPLPVAREERRVDVEDLVAVQREDGASSCRSARREAEPAAAPERLGLPDGDDLGAEPAELGREELLLPGRAGDDDALDAGGASSATW